ncbi:angiopoietin-related protein 4-like [Osmerus mordax]|uniref:angiopoietin-related protein 4-like n=1 Tax=Osmerus mordax TaxID=8014 RepID=UPI00350EF18B
MQTPVMLLLLVGILVQATISLPLERNRAEISSRDMYASWDDVNVVAHGLLQLGHGLKEHVEKTKSQMRDISSKLKAFNGTVAELARNSLAQGEALAKGAREMEDRKSQEENISSEMMVKVEELRAERRDIHARMERLEEKVDGALKDSNNSNHGDVSFIQRILDAQNKRIDDLVEKIRQQQDKLEKQNSHLHALQGKVMHKKFKSLVRRRDEETARKSTEQRNSQTGFAKDCHELFLQGQTSSGVYSIQPHNSLPFEVLCEMTSEGGWTVIQKRLDGSQNFNQLWEAYQKGFGSLTGEFWLGLENIHALSNQGENTLVVEVSDLRGEVQPVQYPFYLDGEENNYALHLGSRGNQQSALHTGSSGLPFSTSDRDNDQRADLNCAQHLSGGWWFSDCGNANLNGKFPKKNVQRQQTRRQLAFWNTMTSHHRHLKTVVMKIAPASIKS